MSKTDAEGIVFLKLKATVLAAAFDELGLRTCLPNTGYFNREGNCSLTIVVKLTLIVHPSRALFLAMTMNILVGQTLNLKQTNHFSDHFWQTSQN